jgi:MbtH protein
MSRDAEDPISYKVVVNDEEQYSLWPASKRDNPPGWRDAGCAGTKQECLDFVNRVWTDMRPRSLREKMDAAHGNDTARRSKLA